MKKLINSIYNAFGQGTPKKKLSLKNLTVAYATVVTVWIRPCLELVEVCDISDAKVDDLSVKVIEYCKSHNVEDAVEIPRCLQNIMLEGRALSIQDPTSFDDGETNFIMVD